MNRNRLFGFACIFMATSLVLALALPAIAFLAVPTRTKPTTNWRHVVIAASVPADGVPRNYAVSEEPRDAWTRHPDRIIDRVYLVSEPGSSNLQAYRVYHHTDSFAGPVCFDAEKKGFHSNCYGMWFGLDGKLLNENRRDFSDDMRPVPVKIEEGVVWVQKDDASAWGYGRGMNHK